jgi:Flagellar biosynthesis protein, FliO
MQGWLDEVAGPGYSQALLWALLALLVLVVLLFVIKLIRSMTFGTFIAGGRNRKNRLAVMDATAVDSHRRLVLVRRDDVEHLLLIGGASDIVVEGDIRIGQQQRRNPTPAPEPARDMQPPVPQPPVPQPPVPRPPVPRPPVPQPPVPQPLQAPPQQAIPARHEPARPSPPPAPAPRAPVIRPEPPRPVQPQRSEPRASAPYAPAPPRPAMPAANSDDLDDALLRELQVSLDDDGAKAQPRGPTQSLDDEMAKLLGELSNPRR